MGCLSRFASSPDSTRFDTSCNASSRQGNPFWGFLFAHVNAAPCLSSLVYFANFTFDGANILRISNHNNITQHLSTHALLLLFLFLSTRTLQLQNRLTTNKQMTIFSTGVGATLGLALQFYSNGVRKLPLWRQPWLHVSFIIGGAYAGHCERAKRAVTSSTKQNTHKTN